MIMCSQEPQNIRGRQHQIDSQTEDPRARLYLTSEPRRSEGLVCTRIGGFETDLAQMGRAWLSWRRALAGKRDEMVLGDTRPSFEAQGRMIRESFGLCRGIPSSISA